MSPSELGNLVDWIEDRWPGTRSFRHIEKIASDFQAIPDKAIWEAAWNYYNAGHRTAPTSSELREAALRIARAQGDLDPQATDCDARGQHGAWAIINLPPKDGTAMREAQCVDCGTIRIGPASELLTVGEAAERDKRGEAPDDPLSERIAP